MKIHLTRGCLIRLLIAASAACLMLAAIAFPLPGQRMVPGERKVLVDARAFAYEPGSLTVQRGDTVTIELTALDTVHGFSLDGYGVNLVAEPGKSATVSFVADREGKFKFRCSVACGALHPFMLGELNVEPNTPLVRALFITLAGVMGAVALFWK